MTFALGLLAALLAIATPVWVQQTVRIGTTPAVTFVVLYGAEQLGYFKADGITAQFSDFRGSPAQAYLGPMREHPYES